MSDDEVEKMVRDAEAHADEDKKFQALVGARNQADSLIHASRKSMAELGDKLEADEKSSIEAAIKDLEEAIKGDDLADIEAKTKALTDASAKMAERLYAEQAQQAEAASSEGAEGAETGSGKRTGTDDDVVDAEFEEVNDNKK